MIAVFVIDEQDHILAARSAMIGSSAAAIKSELPEDLRRQHASRIAGVRAAMTGSVVLSGDRSTTVSYYPLLMNVDEHTLRPARRAGDRGGGHQFAKSKAIAAAGRQAVQYVLLFSGLAGCIWLFIHFGLTRRVARLVATTYLRVRPNSTTVALNDSLRDR